MGEELVAGAAPAERLRLGRGSRPSSPGGASGPPPDMARRVPEHWRVPALRYRDAASARWRPLSQVRLLLRPQCATREMGDCKL
eukprot:12568488-Alexandrium_andersonii.AAC.1